MKDNLNIVIVGAGAIGASVGFWLKEAGHQVWFKDKGATATKLRDRGILVQGLADHSAGSAAGGRPMQIPVIDDLREVASIDVLVIAVKNYHLEACCQELVGQLPTEVAARPLVVGLQNGVTNQEVLPRYFSQVVLGVVGYNAWLADATTVVYQNRGPLVLGALVGVPSPKLDQLVAAFRRAFPTLCAPTPQALQEAIHAKLIINLTNSFTTLVDYRFETCANDKVFQRILTRLTWEGVQVVRQAGMREFVIEGMPRWRLMAMAANLPRFVTKRKFRASLKKMVVSSMAQDIIQRQQTDSELSSINGQIIDLARKHGVAAPYNETIYDLCHERFAAQPFRPMTLPEVWAAINARG